MHLRTATVVAGLLSVALIVTAVPVGAAPVPATVDGLRAFSIIPPGQDGFVSLGQVVGGARGPHLADQLAMYAALPDDDHVTESELLDYFHSARFGPGETIEREYKPRADVTVYRDGFGIPHVYGDTDAGAAFALGYVSAEDRLWQMDVLRHAARGDLASLLGPDYVAFDTATRRDGYTAAEVDALFEGLDEEFGTDGALLQDMLRSYADGINTRIAEVRASPALLPAEHAGQGLSIEDWKVSDTAFLAIFQLRQFGEGGGYELENAALLASLRSRLGKKRGTAAFREILVGNDANSYTTIAAGEGRFPSQTTGSVDPRAVALPDKAPALVRATSSLDRSAAAQARRLRGDPPASNFIAVAPDRSATGNALQLGGPQLGFTMPALVLEIDVHSPTFDFRGPALPGASVLVPLGRGRTHAWSLTSGNSDLVDVRVEKLCGGGDSYLFDGECRAMEERIETISVRGSQPVDVTIQRTVHGPVIGRGTVKGAPVAIVKQRAFWMNELDTVIAFLRAGRNTVASRDDFADAMSVATMSFNAVYAGPDGIAYFHVGQYPRRAPGVDPMLPSWGTGRWEWRGMVPFSSNPQIAAPARGWIVNWNNQPSRGWANGDSSHWGPTQRVKILAEAMRKRVRGDRKVSLSDIVDVVREAATTDVHAVLLGRRMLRLARRLEGQPGEIRRTIASWRADGAHRRDRNRDERQDHGAAVAAMDLWYDNLAAMVFDDELSGAYEFTVPISHDPRHTNGSSYYADLSNQLWNLLGPVTRKAMGYDFCDDIRTERVETCRFQVRRALKKTAATLTRRFGRNLARWRAPADYMTFSKVGAPAVPDIPWQNRGTYNHAIEVTGTG